MTFEISPGFIFIFVFAKFSWETLSSSVTFTYIYKFQIPSSLDLNIQILLGISIYVSYKHLKLIIHDFSLILNLHLIYCKILKISPTKYSEIHSFLDYPSLVFYVPSLHF